MSARLPDAALRWFGVLGGPLAWMFQLLAGYGVEEVACGSGTATHGFWGVSPLTLTAIVSTAALVVAAAALGAAAASRHRTERGRTFDGARAYTRFVAVSGVLLSAYFLAMIALTTTGVLTLDPCEAS